MSLAKDLTKIVPFSRSLMLKSRKLTSLVGASTFHVSDPKLSFVFSCSARWQSVRPECSLDTSQIWMASSISLRCNRRGWLSLCEEPNCGRISSSSW